MKQPLPAKRTWTGRGPRRLKSASGLSASSALRLAHAVNRVVISDALTDSSPSSPESANAAEMTLRAVSKPRQGVREKPISKRLQAQEAQGIEAQAARVEQLSQELRIAMAELKAMTGAVNQQGRTAQGPSASNDSSNRQSEVREAAIAPPVASTQPATVTAGVQSPNLNQAKQEASSNAQFLRRLKRRRSYLRFHAVDAQRRSQSRGHHRRWRQGWLQLQRALRPPASLAAFLSDAAVWIAVAAALRVGFQLLVSAYPLFWLPLGFAIATVSLLVTYQVLFNAKSGSIWGYRLLLVLLGLLLGGRF